jgi:ubiquinone/menaquinone biosynthesis C-methylase UbiE
MSVLVRLFDYSESINRANFIRLLEVNPTARLLDLGCGRGEFAAECAGRMGTKEIYGVELDDECLAAAQGNGIRCVRADLNQRLPLESHSFDVITANQVIEHLTACDVFMEEIYRVLKPGGYAVVSTENLASWHNIFALVLGYRPFSVFYIPRYFGNPLSPHNKEEESTFRTHVRVFSYRPFREIFELYSLKVESLLGAGYYPMPSGYLSRAMSQIDPRHAHFLTVKARK